MFNKKITSSSDVNDEVIDDEFVFLDDLTVVDAIGGDALQFAIAFLANGASIPCFPFVPGNRVQLSSLEKSLTNVLEEQTGGQLVPVYNEFNLDSGEFTIALKENNWEPLRCASISSASVPQLDKVPSNCLAFQNSSVVNSLLKMCDERVVFLISFLGNQTTRHYYPDIRESQTVAFRKIPRDETQTINARITSFLQGSLGQILRLHRLSNFAHGFSIYYDPRSGVIARHRRTCRIGHYKIYKEAW